MKKILSFAAIALTGVALASCSKGDAADGSITQKHARFLTEPYGYVAYRTAQPLHMDGILNEAAWQAAPETELFADISGEGFAEPKYKTTAKILWDDDYLYVGATLEEPNVWANLTQRDTVIYYDPDFEIFIDPTGDAHNYYELEWNARGTLFDLSLEMPYRAPRRNFVQFQWDCPGLKYAVKVNGTLNNHKDTDEGWVVECAIPRKALAQEFDNIFEAGKYLRLGFSRVEWQTELLPGGRTARKKGPDGKYLPEDNWTWPSTGQIAMHMPERWSYILLSDKNAGEGKVDFQYPDYRPIERLLWAMFYEQEAVKAETGKYLDSEAAFNLTSEERDLLPSGSTLTVETMTGKYLITAETPKYVITIDEDGQILRTEK